MIRNNKVLLLAGLICFLHLFTATAYPVLNVRRLFDSAIEGRYKKSDLINAQTDTDVRELENLKQDHENNKSDTVSNHPFDSSLPSSSDTSDSSSEESSINHSNQLPETQQQESETITTSSSPAPSILITSAPSSNVEVSLDGQQENEPLPSNNAASHNDNSQHRPPMLPFHDGGKVPSQQVENSPGENAIASAAVHSMSKPFYGAARLAFGQNPEILPTLTSSTSTSTTTTTKTISSGAAPATNESIPESIMTSTATTNVSLMPDDSVSHERKPSDPANEETLSMGKAAQPLEGLNKEEVGDLAVDELEAAKTRRSVTLMPPKSNSQAAETLFKHKDGQYSSFDMAQYVFWTGDEAGVARAVEEFIQQGLMSRENAIKFLRDIRVGIEYLQNSYSNRGLPSDLRENNIKKNIHTEGMKMTTRATVTPAKVDASTTTEWSTVKTTPTTTTEKPFPRVVQHSDRTDERKHSQTGKTLQGITSLVQLQEINSARKSATSEYDESAGRAKIAEFLYTEYSLEEVIYQLAKVMFTQSLTHGSDEAQEQLQKLTNFLEDEGKRGLISPSLQKKVLDVLLSALSDTLVEHPELLSAARANLGNSFHKIPGNALDSVRN